MTPRVKKLFNNRFGFKPQLVAFEDRITPTVFAGIPDDSVLITPDDGGIPRIKIVNPATGEDIGEIQAYEDSFRGGVNTAVGDITGDGVNDLVIAPGVGGGPRIKIVDGNSGATLADFFVYEPNFRGGVTVALGDVNGDGKDDIITGTGKGGGPRVRILDGASLGQTVIKDYFAYESNFRGGVLVSSGDINGDGVADIVTGTGPGGGPRVSAVSGKDGSTLKDFFAYDNRFRGGVKVSVGDVNGDGKDDIITGTGPGGGAVVRTFSGKDASTLNTFFSDDTAFRGGVRVEAHDLDGDGKAEIVSRTRHGNDVTVRVFDGVTGQFRSSVGRLVDDNPHADDSTAPVGGGSVTPGTVSAIEGTVAAVNATAGTLDLVQADGTTVVVQAGPGTKIERNDFHTTLSAFIVGDKVEVVFGPDGVAWAIESKTNTGGEHHTPDGTVVGKVEGLATAINVAAGTVTVHRSNGQDVVITAAVGAKIERNDVTATLSNFVVGDRVEALIGSDGLATKIEAVAIVIGGGGNPGSGGTITGIAPPINANIEGTITAINVATNQVTIRTAANVNYLIQIVPGTKVERNDIETSIASYKLSDHGQAKTDASGLTFKLESVGP